ncbi:MAG: 5-formyltetrahydrofolate cyclo-ligase [Proteobacteria bacterium]|nr:5-formyltetrahydrofolate cyclo-ligase [Pseudomonadota bacterium]MBU4276386.1 5-formyltetrahydrofolate cyclo-ligase [Pseudomonadota bacterium]MBU4383725.1 5-formyltetrahydrofolate cyclo-ligase [Pseudomonadota bacterium]MCG2763947.1 5-formyltetrahydrofolate cyclo-ligase [Desulfarculaceae bacterium]
MMPDKNELREQLSARWQELWPQELETGRAPMFDGAGKAAERLRRLKEYHLARVLVVTPEPCLLQVRINALNDNKSLLATTPGLKQGLMRITPPDVPLPLRSRALRGWSLAESGHLVRLPTSRPGKAELLVGAALAVDRRGRILGDGRGMLDFSWALLRHLKVISDETPVAVVVHDEQILEELPEEPWDLMADLVITPTRVLRMPAVRRPKGSLEELPEHLASLPVTQAALGR